MVEAVERARALHNRVVELQGNIVIFDEAHLTSKSKDVPLAAETLQRLGYYSRNDWMDDDSTCINDNEDLILDYRWLGPGRL